ncbi:MAG: hypothetical protein IIA87_00295 [Nanoarchaeota archaeon]|nr:hypothetical protein [Nanoarchaeota archaeon]
MLPDFLIDVLDEVIEGFEGDEFEHHGPPRECREAGVTDRQGCMRIMILESDEIPRECRSALSDALDRGVTSERKFREICEEIMYDQYAPSVCAERGITDSKECAGLFEGGEFDRRGPGHGFDFRSCAGMEDPQERLQCYDGGFEGDFHEGGSFEERLAETFERERQCARSCADQGKPWDFSGGTCRCGDVSDRRDYSEYYDRERGDYRGYGGGDFDCAVALCQQGTTCVQGVGCVPDNGGGFSPPERYGGEFPPPECPPDTYWDGSTCVSPELSPEPYPEPESGTSGSGTITGGFITGNAFLDYYFRW